jgi:hypothetical protein
MTTAPPSSVSFGMARDTDADDEVLRPVTLCAPDALLQSCPDQCYLRISYVISYHSLLGALVCVAAGVVGTIVSVVIAFVGFHCCHC